jgi:hypothetical protein
MSPLMRPPLTTFSGGLVGSSASREDAPRRGGGLWGVPRLVDDAVGRAADRGLAPELVRVTEAAAHGGRPPRQPRGREARRPGGS